MGIRRLKVGPRRPSGTRSNGCSELEFPVINPQSSTDWLLSKGCQCRTQLTGPLVLILKWLTSTTSNVLKGHSYLVPSSFVPALGERFTRKAIDIPGTVIKVSCAESAQRARQSQGSNFYCAECRLVSRINHQSSHNAAHPCFGSDLSAGLTNLFLDRQLNLDGHS